MPKPVPDRWCLLIHSLPARPLYLRARVRRLLEQLGAAPLRKAVYALPASPQAIASLRAVLREIEAGGGSAIVCEATFPDGATAASVVQAYNDEIARRYRAWSTDAERTMVARRGRARAAGGSDGGTARRLAALRGRLEQLQAHDRFAAPGSAGATALLERAERAAGSGEHGAALTGLRWVTRRGVHVDRIACAWVVRRFIDARATFRFTADPTAALGRNEIGFDMPNAAIGHRDGGCSMETLIARAGLDDPRLRYVADIVHDIDIKDGRHGHPETSGFEQLLVGFLSSTPADDDRMEQGMRLFDALYAAPLPGAVTHTAPPPRIRVPAGLKRRGPR